MAEEPVIPPAVDRLNNIVVTSSELLDAYVDAEHRDICPDCGGVGHLCAKHNAGHPLPSRMCYPFDDQACSRGCVSGDYCARWLEDF